MVTPHNPLKEEVSLMSDELRLKLVRLAIEGIPSSGLPISSFICRARLIPSIRLIN